MALQVGLGDFHPTRSTRGNFNFSAYILDSSMISRVADHTIEPSLQYKFNESGSKIIYDLLGQRYLSPYTFAGNTLLVVQCSLGGEGRCLSSATDLARVRNQGIPLKYESHNIDSSAQACTLISLLTNWAEHAEAFLA